MTIPNSLRALHGTNKGLMAKGNQYSASISLIKEEPGFNARGDYSDQKTKAHIRKLANAYKRGDRLPALEVVVRDGEILVRDGHCRLRAIHLANAEGANIERVPLAPVEGDEVDQVTRIVTSQDGLKLPALGLAQVYFRLVGLGLTADEVAERLQRSNTHVKDYLELYNLPIDLKKLIEDEVISPLEALKQYREHGTQAIGLIEEIHSEIVQRNNEESANQKVAADSIKGNEAPQPATDGDKEPAGDSDKETESAAKPQKPVRVTRKAIESKLGYRSSLKGAVVQRIGKTIDSLVDRIPAEDDGDMVTVELTREEILELRDLQKSVKPKMAGEAEVKGGATLEGESIHPATTETAGLEQQVA